jgi:hypothetical protein
VGYLRVLKHRHSASSIVEHVCTDVEGIDTAFGSGMEIDQELKLFDKSVKEIVCVLLWSRSFLVPALSDLCGEVRTQA